MWEKVTYNNNDFYRCSICGRISKYLNTECDSEGACANEILNKKLFHKICILNQLGIFSKELFLKSFFMKNVKMC